MSAGSDPTLSISIIHLGGVEMLRDCLASIPAACARATYEVVVVDNESCDGSREMVRAEFPHVRLSELDYRQGFSANHNLAQSQSHAPFLCLLNNDTVLHPNALDQLVDFLEANLEVGIVGPMVWNPDGTPQASCGPFPSLRSELMANCLPSRWLPRPVVHVRIDPQSSICWPDWIGGVCLTTRRVVWEALNGLDAEFFLFFEETDFCNRATNAGWKVAHPLTAGLVHLGGQSTGHEEMRTKRAYIYAQSQLRFFRKHKPRWQQGALRLASAASFGLRALLWSAARRREQAHFFWQSARMEMGL